MYEIFILQVHTRHYQGTYKATFKCPACLVLTNLRFATLKHMSLPPRSPYAYGKGVGPQMSRCDGSIRTDKHGFV